MVSLIMKLKIMNVSQLEISNYHIVNNFIYIYIKCTISQCTIYPNPFFMYCCLFYIYYMLLLSWQTAHYHIVHLMYEDTLGCNFSYLIPLISKYDVTQVSSSALPSLHFFLNCCSESLTSVRQSKMKQTTPVI